MRGDEPSDSLARGETVRQGGHMGPPLRGTMKYDPDIHHRRSIRLRGYDYSSAGAYFVTICTQGREYLFGDIADGAMHLNGAGRMVAEWWLKLPDKFPGVMLDEYVIMPNHFHGIIVIDNVRAPLAAPLSSAPLSSASAPLAAPDADSGLEIRGTSRGAASSAPTLGNIMRAFKSISAIEINRTLDRQGRLWQRNYYERIIRDDDELSGIREYIRLNPVKWADDDENLNHADPATSHDHGGRAD